MAVIYMTHPVYGQKVATSDMEADYDARNGWSRAAAEEASAAEALADEASAEETPDAASNRLAAAHGSRRRRLPAQEA
jgi:hypothetical protein